MVGLGGIYAEVFEDVAVGLAPLDPRRERLLRSLRGAALLARRPRPAAARHRRRGARRGSGALAAGGGAS